MDTGMYRGRTTQEQLSRNCRGRHPETSEYWLPAGAGVTIDRIIRCVQENKGIIHATYYC